MLALLVAAASLGYTLTRPSASTTSSQTSTPQSRSFVVIVEKQNFSESTAGIPNYTFAPTSIVVNQGDKVTILFYNTDTSKHTFTIGAPYNVNMDLSGGMNSSVTFTASTAGVFLYYCQYHFPTMEGQLIVLAD